MFLLKMGIHIQSRPRTRGQYLRLLLRYVTGVGEPRNRDERKEEVAVESFDNYIMSISSP